MEAFAERGWELRVRLLHGADSAPLAQGAARKDLDPEQADTITVGLVISPLDRMNIAIDTGTSRSMT
jgi:hypothetical protein